MGKMAKQFKLDAASKLELEGIISNGRNQTRLLLRAKMALLFRKDKTINQIAGQLDIRPKTVIL